MSRSYSELIKIESMIDRVKYLMIRGTVGRETFGSYRYLNQVLYNSSRWKQIRKKIILRDNGNDLGMNGFSISGPVYIHHINPISIEDIHLQRSCIFDHDNLICCSYDTHQMIHYGFDPSNDLRFKKEINRKPGDTCLWAGCEK